MAVRDRLLKCLLQAGLDDVDVPALQRLDGFLIDGLTSKPQTSNPASASVIAVGRPM